MNRMMKFMLPAVATVGLLATTAHANPQITEVWTGLSGEDGTADWFEITNFGPGSIDTGDYVWDDSSSTFAGASAIDSFILAPGESAVFLADTGAADDVTYANALDEFLAIWGAVANVGYADGPGLGQGGDEVNLFDAGGTIVDTVAYTSSGDLATFDDSDGDGIAPLSVLGVNGAYESAAFFNDNLSLPNDSATLIGSPGIVPEPASLALAALEGIALLSRRG